MVRIEIFRFNPAEVMFNNHISFVHAKLELLPTASVE